MGVVYRGRDERLRRDVALKVLPAGLLADEAARHKFRNEALALSQIVTLQIIWRSFLHAIWRTEPSRAGQGIAEMAR